jgi:hypothetical protein
MGRYGLLVVSTSAPLRHLHSPEECLAGNGHTVRYLGQTGGVTPSAVYRTTDPQGQSWRITVSFVSERGGWTPHVAEAIWRWLQAPGHLADGAADRPLGIAGTLGGKLRGRGVAGAGFVPVRPSRRPSTPDRETLTFNEETAMKTHEMLSHHHPGLATTERRAGHRARRFGRTD